MSTRNLIFLAVLCVAMCLAAYSRTRFEEIRRGPNATAVENGRHQSAGFAGVALVQPSSLHQQQRTTTTPPESGTPSYPRGAADIRIHIDHIDQNVFNRKRPIVLTTAEALLVFKNNYPNLAPDWRNKLGRHIENLPNATPLSEGVRKAMIKINGTPPFASLQEFSRTSIRVLILKPAGQYLWHQEDECLADFSFPRSQAIEKIFPVQAEEQRRAVTFKGVGFGASVQAVVTALGKPDGSIGYQPFGMMRFAYFKDDVVIYFESNRVAGISRGVPPDLKRRFRDGGPHLIG